MKLQKIHPFIKSLIKSNFLLLSKKKGRNINILDIKVTLRGLKQLVRLFQHSSKIVLDPADKYFESCLRFLSDKYLLNICSITNYLSIKKSAEKKVYITFDRKNFEFLTRENIHLSCFVTTSSYPQKRLSYSLFNEIHNIEKFLFLLCLIKKISESKKKL